MLEINMMESFKGERSPTSIDTINRVLVETSDVHGVSIRHTITDLRTGMKHPLSGIVGEVVSPKEAAYIVHGVSELIPHTNPLVLMAMYIRSRLMDARLIAQVFSRFSFN